MLYNQTDIENKITTMKKNIVIALALASTFALGFGFKTITTKQTKNNTSMKKVTGIGGIFFKCKDTNKMKEWYKTHLGIDAGQYGANFEWRQEEDPNKKGSTAWNTFAETTKYFEPSTKDFMINYRVADLEALVVELKKEGVTIVDKIETYDYGKFVHIVDMEGNKIQLWEPKD